MIIVLDVRIHYLQRLSTTQYLKEFFFLYKTYLWSTTFHCRFVW